MDNSRDARPSMLGIKSSTSSSRFPLAPNFFSTVNCTEEQHDFLAEQARRLSTDAIQTAKWAMSYEDGTNGWKLSNSQRHFRETGIRTYCRRRDAKDRNGQRQLEFRCMGKAQMTLDNCLTALYSDNTTDFHSNTMFLLENALDAVVLHALERKSDDKPHHYLGLNWLASRSPGLFAKNRDICFLRSMGTAVDSNKTKVGYEVTQSIELKECGSLENSLGLMRAKLSAVLLFKENTDTRSTNLLWQGSIGLTGHSSSKLVNFVHETFTSVVTNLNKFMEAKYMAQQVEGNKLQRMIIGERKHCYICNKRFSLVRTRYQCSACGENICKDCEVSSRAKAFNSDSFDVPTPTSSRPEVALFCKQCVSAARRDLHNHPDGARANPSFLLVDNNNLYPDTSADEGDPRQSTAGKVSNQSSSTSTSSLQKLSNARSSGGPAQRNSKRADKAPLFVGTTMDMSSASAVPISPLSIRTEREKRRSRLETDPMESYDGFDNQEYGVPLETDEYDPQEPVTRESASSYSSYMNTPDRRGSQESRDNDMANRLRELSQRAQEAYDVTKRNSCMMSDTSSAPRVSDLSAFKDLDKSIAEQADLLNVIGFVSTGRVLMENEQGSVRVSESSSIMSEDERFEVIT
ncbi:hypothetical protein PHYBOEH_004790 [Phytophthora boehmeriae]|uniref:FYVE-type domain-containing protein n=1 Tax=Phytophthora boehmeriae TaxID=109152 RepID=A0A8T1WSI5_9STRA|nr:hypothetical protein PHYBOEH_004790 [Phytophthora boehmeriae]